MRPGQRGWVLAAVALGLALGHPRGARAQDEGADFFEKRVRPVLVARCARCHGADVEKPKGGLRLVSRASLLKGGTEGPAVVPGDAEHSLIAVAVRRESDDLRMPPDRALEPDDVRAIEEWIRRGAPWPAGSTVAGVATVSWAFRPLRAPATPDVRAREWPRTALDRFVLARLEAQGLTPSPPADRRTLYRRASFDLTGLPPSPEEVEAFVRDPDPGAFARVVDRLLASPRHGERWGRHWLDVARYSDSKGYVFQEERRFRGAYTYRDWVVRALNEDMPYDQFLVQQIAADRLDLGGDPRPLAALGFLTLGRRFLNNPHDIVDDRIDVVARGTLGLTVACARCHDHKFDPIPQRDYYALYGVFASSHEPAVLPLLDRSPSGPAYEAFLRELAARQAEREAWKRTRRDEIARELASPRVVEEYLDAVAVPGDAGKVAAEKQLNALVLERWRTFLGGAHGDPGFAPWDVPLAEIEALFDGKDQGKLRELTAKVDEVEASHPGAPARAMALEEDARPHDPHVFQRGDPNRPGEAVPRQFLACLDPQRKPWATGGRLELARAIASPENPLTARVIANRIWAWHTGAPLVRTPSDFGARSEAPSNPELLDHLAAFLVEHGWSWKALHREILLSAAWQQSSADDPAKRARDPENALFWRQNRQRLDFEATRDTVLWAAGELDETLGGRAVELDSRRRTLYAFVDRQNLPGTFRAFDFANPDATSPRRAVTTVPQQALWFLSSPFVLDRARALAARGASEPDPGARVRALYRRLYSREPDEAEVALARGFLAHPVEVPLAAAWSYGWGEVDPATRRVLAFAPLPHWTGTAWQGGPALPDPKLGWCVLHATGGHPGNDRRHDVIRRWTSPVAGPVLVDGRLAHRQKQGDGVRASLVSSREGEVAAWTVHDGEARTRCESVAVEPGTTLDLVVDCRANESYDSFEWTARITAADGEGTWDSARDFAGPSARPLSAWEEYAHVLLSSDELVFVD